MKAAMGRAQEGAVESFQKLPQSDELVGIVVEPKPFKMNWQRSWRAAAKTLDEIALSLHLIKE
jgi:hypothetical protein